MDILDRIVYQHAGFSVVGEIYNKNKREKESSFNYIDLGPSGTMANFIRNNLGKDSLSKFYDVLTPFGQDLKKLEKLKQSIG